MLSIVGGVIIIVMGLHFLGVFRIAFLNRQMRMDIDNEAGPVGSYLMGLAFAIGWTPCIGPVLGTILLVAGTEQTVRAGRGPARGLFAGAGVAVPLRGVLRRAVHALHAPVPRPSRHS